MEAPTQQYQAVTGLAGAWRPGNWSCMILSGTDHPIPIFEEGKLSCSNAAEVLCIAIQIATTLCLKAE